MLPSSDSFAFGYADFYHAYLSIPFNRSLVELSGIPLPSPGVFSVHNPLHVVVAAQHGHQIFPIDEASFKARVKDDAPYASNVQARMDEFKQMLEDFNAEQKRLSIYMGGSVTFVIDDTPFTIEQFEMFGLGDTILAQAAMQFERDRNFHRHNRCGIGRSSYLRLARGLCLRSRGIPPPRQYLGRDNVCKP